MDEVAKGATMPGAAGESAVQAGRGLHAGPRACALRVNTSSTIPAFVIACCLALPAWSAGAQEAADNAEEQEAADNAEEKEEVRSIDEQLWDAVAAQDRELVTKLLGRGADGGALVEKGGFHIGFSMVRGPSSDEGEGADEKPRWQTNLRYSYRANTALRKSVEDGSSEMVRLLLAAGADDADDVAFQHAVREGHIEVVRDFLVARSDDGSDWEGPIVCGESCRDQYRGELGEKLRGHLLKSANAEAFSLFRQVGLVIDSDNLSPEQASALLMAGFKQKDVEKVLMAVAGGADPNLTDRGIPLLAVAAWEYPQVVTALLDAGADVNAKVTGEFPEAEGYTALHYAASKGHEDVVAVLLGRGAAIDSVSEANSSGSVAATPLMFAANNGHAAVARTLIDAGADVNAKVTGEFSKVEGLEGFTALHYAASKGHEDVVAVLLGRGAAIDSVSEANSSGSVAVTPLMLAANKGHAAVVRTLIDAGADVKLKVSGVTALKVTENKDIERMLKDAKKRRD